MVQITLNVRDDIYNLLVKYARNVGVSVEDFVGTILSLAVTLMEHYRFFKNALKRKGEE